MEQETNRVVKENVKTASTNKLAVFIVFFIISFVFWVLNYLSSDYSSSFNYQLKFDKFPTSKILVGKPSIYVTVNLKAKGFKLIRKNIALNENVISLDVQSMKLMDSASNTYFISLSKYYPQIIAAIGPDYQLQGISPDIIYFKFDNEYSKKIPVILNLSVEPKKQYRLSRKIQIMPDCVLVKGPQKIIDTLSFVSTNLTKYENVDKSFSGNVLLNDKLTKDYNLFYSTKAIGFVCDIEKYTEEKVVSTVISTNANYSILTLPEKVTIYYKVNIKDYNKISANSFKLGVDIDKYGKTSGNLALIQILKKPDFVDIIRIVPDRVEYIIKK